MTLKYESEILFDLMKRDGDDTPSDVLPYESELKEKYLKQVEGAYPKLMDYRPEWLNYNLYHHLPSDFPTESVTNVTNATFENVVPYAYKSAILKGQTLVNLIQTVGKTILEQYQDVVSLIQVKPSTKYLLKIKNNTSEAKSFYSSQITEWTQIDIGANQTITKILTTKSILGRNTLLQNLKTHTTEHDLSIIFIEYQDGMENWDIPYFEGMQSVKMPVLKTVGKNLILNKNDVKVNSTDATVDYKDGGFSFDLSESKWQNVWYDLNLKPNTKYTISYNSNFMDCFVFKSKVTTYVSTEVVARVEIKNKNEDTLQSTKLTFTSPSSGFVRIRLTNSYMSGHHVVKNIQLEEGSTPSSYESYKSNILTVNEDVTLRSNGSVYDELDLLTGKLTQRIDEDGSVLTQEVVKTVDLSCINEQGENETIRPIEGTMHVNTSSQTFPALLDMSVPVEAISQNLMSFANIVEEE